MSEKPRIHAAASETPPLSQQERLMESPAYKRERLQDLTGIEDEQVLFEIYSRLQDLFGQIGLENLKYRRNTVDDRRGIETEFVLLNLDGEQLAEVEEILKELRIFGFPEPVSGTNYTSLVIENRRDLEVLRLLSVFKGLDSAQDEARWREQLKELQEKHRVQWEAQERRHAEVRERRAREEAEQERINAPLRKWDEEKRLLEERRAKEKEEMETKIADILAKIKPQEIDLDIELNDLVDPFEEVTGFRGFQPQFPRERRRGTRPTPHGQEARQFSDELDPMDVDEKMETFTQLWEGGAIVDLEEEPVHLPGSRVDLSIFPKRFLWKVDPESKSQAKKCYEYDPVTKQIGREVGKEERNEYILELSRLRAVRQKQEIEQEKELPKSHTETELEQKVILLLNNLVVWLINDLTSHLRGNVRLREMKENDADDLYQQAILGMLYAIDHYDPDKVDGSNPVSYIMACMEGYVRRTHWAEHDMALQKQQVRLPSHIVTLQRKIQKAERLLRSQFPAETDGEKMEARLAEALSQPGVDVLPVGGGIPALRQLREKVVMDYEESAIEILDAEDLDIDARVNGLAELLYEEPTQEVYMERMHLKAAVNGALALLSPREEAILRARFFPKGHNLKEVYLSDPHKVDGGSLDEIGDRYGVSRERIRQLEAKALRRLRHPGRLKRSGLASYGSESS